jgi:uncharacterized membrane protein (UPF0127 family)
MKKIFILLLIVGLGFYVYIQNRQLVDKFLPSKNNLRTIQLSEYRIEPVTLGRKKYFLYVAQTEPQRVEGLSHVSSLRSDQGMIFTFPLKQQLSFWMKDMKFNLDFVFIEGKTVVDIREDVSPSTYPALITGVKEGDKAIELPAGQIQQSGLQVGDSINIHF